MNTVIMVIAIIIFAVIPSFKDRVIPVKKLLIAPAIFSYLLYQSVTETFRLDVAAIVLLAAGLLAGAFAGFLLRSGATLKADRQAQLIWVPGSYMNLVVFLLLFGVHFVIGYLQSVHPETFVQDNLSEQLLLFLLACFSGLMMGSAACLFYKYFTSSVKVSLKAG
jgi:hypothetical protein